MKYLLPKTIFGRLFALILSAIVVSHLMTIGLLFIKFGHIYLPLPPHSPPHPERQHVATDDMGRSPVPVHEVSLQARRSDKEYAGEQHFRHPPPPIDGMIVSLLIQFATLTLAAWFGAKVLARPIQQLAQAASLLGDNLHAPPVLETGPVEARQAARIFNHMQERVRNQVMERERFLAAVSHDLRTPLTRMALRTGRLADGIIKEKLHADIAEMANMLEATLNYIRGKSSREAQQILDVQSLIGAMVEDAIENGQDVSVAGTALPLLTQPMALRSCLSNLVENGLRYGERAKITLIDTPDALLIEIHDAGPGIPEDKMIAVLEPFVRLESSRNKAYGGVGLGLAIANEAASLCGGCLTLRNAEGGGLVASIFLPRWRK